MPHQVLNDGRRIPSLGLGVWDIAQDETAAAVLQALELGYRHIDTAAAYGNERGVGQALVQSGLPRDEVFITTKVWNTHHGREKATASVHQSLERLGLDSVDLLLIHWPCPVLGLTTETWETLIDLQQQGLARSIGVSNFEPAHISALVKATGVRPVVNQIELHPQFQNRAAFEFNRQNAIITQAWSPLARAGDVLRDPLIAQMAARYGKSPAQVVLRWHLQEGRVVFPKSSNAERQRENLQVFDFQLTREDLQAIRAMDTGQRLFADPNDSPYLEPLTPGT
ncbi:aldo/keto reductase [Amphibiibacter pelophylacis]|uniref:Aldo/keto reductase n=1 Tax=Amphibiibacter pelophylacis TaxID=1799477 RepID=A0ACC6P3R6_9BURK